ncbi:peptidase S8/S53 domain-containing protein, partial [Sporodiniella umbellata]
KRDYARMNYYTVRIENSEDEGSLQKVAFYLNAKLEGKVGELDNYYWISIPKERDEGDILTKYEKLKKRDILPVYDIQLQTPSRRLFKRTPLINIQQELLLNQQNVKKSLAISDPGFERQWHLINTQEKGHDLNLTGVWSQGITGKGSVVAILDDGLDFEHEDLRDNYYAEGSFDFNNPGHHPKPRLDDDTHGTRCAGEIASSKNDVCGIGVAYDAKVSGIRILSGDVTEGDEAAAINYKYQENQIYSCSWGPSDYGEVAEGPQGIVLEAIKNGVQKGRNGKGSIFVFASGNGGYYDDNCNFDGYTNSIYTITVGAIDRLGNHPSYGEKCAAQFFATYSSGNGHHIYTTDVGSGKCTEIHGGTSAAAPLAAGVFALVLSARPDLTWRDLQHLCVRSAVPVSLQDEDWKKLPSGRMFNHKYGFGVLDAYRIVNLAKTFQSVGPQTSLEMVNSDSLEIPDTTSNQTASTLRSTVTVSEEMVVSKRLSRLEHVTVTVNIQHTKRGDLEILLISPNNVTSQLGTPRKNDHSAEGLINWTFMSVKHWEENAVGPWTLQIIDARNPEHTGRLIEWKLTLWG